MEITIRTIPKFSLRRMIAATATEVCVIGIGVVVGSSAMQWAGFLALVIIVLAASTANESKNKGLSIQQARARLDEIEANNRKV